MKPVAELKNPSIGILLAGAGVGLLFVLFFGWDVLRHFPSTNLAEPFRLHATHFNQTLLNFAVFSGFVLELAIDVAFFLLGIFLVIRTAFVAKKYFTKDNPASQ